MKFLMQYTLSLGKAINIDFPKIMRVPNGKKIYISDRDTQLLYELENVPWTLM